MEETFFDDEITEETRMRRRVVFAFFRKTLWTVLVLCGLLALLLPLTAYLDWWKVPLACLLGLLTGISLAAGILASLQNRKLITLLLGVLILPGLAVYASFLAGSSPQAFETASSVLTPFLSYALAALLGYVFIVNIWRHMPIRGKEEAGKGPVHVVTPEKKEHTSHEGSPLQRVA
jgi:hypothetical protein